MISEKKSNTRLGLFVTIALLLFTAAVYYIGNQQNLFGSKFRISSTFKNINGLQNGNNVRFSGINVGNVEYISIVNDSMIQVDMLLNPEVQAYIKQDAVASIASDGLVGNMIVNITPGRGNMPRVEEGDMIPSYSRLKTDDMFGTLGKTTENIELLARNLLKISENLLSSEGSVPMLLNDQGLARELQLTFANLRKTSESMQQLSVQLADNIADVNEGKGALGYLLTDSLLTDQIQQITSDMDTLIVIKTAPIMDNLNQSSKDIATASAELKRILEEIKLDEGLADAILHDPEVQADFKSMMENLNQGTDRFNENMEAMKHNFLFRGYFRKAERRAKKDAKRSPSKEDSIVVAGE